MNFIEVTPEKYRRFILETDLNIYGICDADTSEDYIDNELIAYGVRTKNNYLHFVREDYIHCCKGCEEEL